MAAWCLAASALPRAPTLCAWPKTSWALLLLLSGCGAACVALQGDDVEILIITKDGIKVDRLELKKD